MEYSTVEERRIKFVTVLHDALHVGRASTAQGSGAICPERESNLIGLEVKVKGLCRVCPTRSLRTITTFVHTQMM